MTTSEYGIKEKPMKLPPLKSKFFHAILFFTFCME
jgi:hypothetical protein